MSTMRVVEICAGAGGQAIGLHNAGFDHAIAVELDENAAQTLKLNKPSWRVAIGDVADRTVWNPAEFEGVELLAGGVPCPPFSVAGKQLGSSDERDLFAWAVEQVATVQPRALLLENVRGLASSRFSAYRQRILDRLAEFGYVGDWRLLQAADFGVAQLRPRFVLVAMRPEDAAYFRWPEPAPSQAHLTVGEALADLMAEGGWPHVHDWVRMANRVGPTLVGGSKKHGGADLGPTRAKAAWATIGVDAKGVADAPPGPDAPHPSVRAPRLTVPMVARLQGWRDEYEWAFTGRKTSQYRQIGNAFPPPVAQAIGEQIYSALRHKGEPHPVPSLVGRVHDPVYKALAAQSAEYLAFEKLVESLADSGAAADTVHERLAVLARDFEIHTRETPSGIAYRLGQFKGFTGQADHDRHLYMEKHRAKVS